MEGNVKVRDSFYLKKLATLETPEIHGGSKMTVRNHTQLFENI